LLLLPLYSKAFLGILAAGALSRDLLLFLAALLGVLLAVLAAELEALDRGEA